MQQEARLSQECRPEEAPSELIDDGSVTVLQVMNCAKSSRRISLSIDDTKYLGRLLNHFHAEFGAGLTFENMTRLCGELGKRTNKMPWEIRAMHFRDFVDAVIPASVQDPSERDTSSARSAVVKAKRSTARGEGRDKILAALNLHHQYAAGSCLNFEPIGVRRLAREAQVSKDCASQFFKKDFGNHAKYKAACRRDAARILAWLKLLNNDYSPHPLFASTPPGEGQDES